MPLFDIIIVTGIVAVFVIFGVTLAWAEYQTRHLSHGRTEQNPSASDSKDNMKLAA